MRNNNHQENWSPNHGRIPAAQWIHTGVGIWGRLRVKCERLCLNRGKKKNGERCWVLISPGLISGPCHYQCSGLFWSTGSLMQDSFTPLRPNQPTTHPSNHPRPSSLSLSLVFSSFSQHRCTVTSNKTHSSHGKVRGCAARWITRDLYVSQHHQNVIIRK